MLTAKKLILISYFLACSLIVNAKEYYTGTYPSDHWALQYPNKTDENFVALFEIDDIQISVIMNPKDSRGYRSIVSLVAKDMATTINREYTLQEQLAFYKALAIVAKAYEMEGLIAQTLVLGNNSHQLDADSNVIVGNAKEPSMLHGHVFGRGDPNQAYIGNVKLKGPPAGKFFTLSGNNGDKSHRVKWKQSEIKVVAKVLAGNIKLLEL